MASQLKDQFGPTVLTTRKHYPGLHRVDVLLNGAQVPLGTFRLRPSA